MNYKFIFIFIVSFFWGIGIGFSEETPEWLKRVELTTQYETDKKPTFYFQTVQPFYQSLDKIDTFFYQPRVSLRDEHTAYNFGIGYRRITVNNIILGLNIFGDYEDLHEHGRAGVGVEALGQVLETRVNSYFGVTSKRVVADAGGSVTYERVADGMDAELGVPLPYLPWIKIYGSGFFYNFSKFADKRGWKSRVEFRLNDAWLVEFYKWDDNKGDPESGGRLRFFLNFDTWTDLKEAFRPSEEPFPKKDLTEEALIPVERNFDIVVEKWTESSGFVVEIGRQ